MRASSSSSEIASARTSRSLRLLNERIHIPLWFDAGSGKPQYEQLVGNQNRIGSSHVSHKPLDQAPELLDRLLAVSSTSSWLSGPSLRPAALLVMHEIAAHSMPRSQPNWISRAVDMPTASAPHDFRA